MKKLVAGACVLAFSIAGLAGCSQGVDKEAVKEKFYTKFIEEVPSGELSDEKIEEFGHCLVDGIFDEISDEQIQDFSKALDKDKIEAGDLPEGVEDTVMKVSNGCAQKILMGDN
ncbi:hypothetical protein [Arcanobacterium buesumense]|uniref:DUF5105 domain-containing protein n=1 Tax=Arcanobacterium buesumense TaxID=2722751 RepID=A0A6H2EIS0_9ACTO|nr:hypothetical protein [Arcanobacterium buesumense]QJC21090.1 hypothetical protein HC352_00195 [Arcanobacterium buesumense]